MPPHLIKLNNELEPYRIKGYLSKEAEFKYLRAQKIFSPKNKLYRHKTEAFKEHQKNLSDLNFNKGKRSYAKQQEELGWVKQEF